MGRKLSSLARAAAGGKKAVGSGGEESQGQAPALAHTTWTHAPSGRARGRGAPTPNIKHFTFPQFMALFDSYSLTG